MAKTMRSSERRVDALTRERIVDVAIELLDADGENGLTFRALATRLETGHGAIQWHVANKNELLRAATAVAVARAADEADPDAPPREAIHAVALGVFDAMDAHPWIGGQLARPPWQSTMLQIFERIGRQVQALGAPASAQFTSTSALLHYIIGAGGQNATNSRSPAAPGGRQHFLDTEAGHWEGLDPREYAFTRTVAGQLRVHDDRAEFLAGIDLILAGLMASH
jgi:AcrR family transcriptional regulator